MLKLSFAALLIVWWWVFVRWASPVSFSSLKSTSTNNTITKANWDTLIDGIVALEERVNKITPQLRTWAVAAFTTSTCPEGWQDYTGANNRFIMWTSTASEVGNPWGRNSVTLTVSNIPAHSHTLNVGWRGSNVGNWTDFVASVWWVRHQSAQWWVYGETTVNTNSAWSASPAAIDITNPYVKLHFCKKISL